jgi:SAM-dependent methyltransferase
MRKTRHPVFDIERAYADCHNVALSLAESVHPARALDLGAGQGAISHALKGRGFNVTAVEVNVKQFKAAGVPCLKLDLNKPLPFPDRAFDLIMAVEIIEHLEAPRAFLREIFRLLNPGGLAVLTTPNITSIPSRIFFLVTGFFDLFVPSRKRLRDQFSSEADGHISPIPGWLARYFLRDLGFVIEKTRYTMAYIPLVPRAILRFFRGPLQGRIAIYAARKPPLP